MDESALYLLAVDLAVKSQYRINISSLAGATTGTKRMMRLFYCTCMRLLNFAGDPLRLLLSRKCIKPNLHIGSIL
jgi:hypothetical protein